MPVVFNTFPVSGCENVYLLEALPNLALSVSSFIIVINKFSVIL